MQIKSLRARTALLPLRRPLVTRVGHFETAPTFLLDLETRAGARACFAAFSFHPLMLKIGTAILEHLVAVTGDADLDLEALPGHYETCLKSLTHLGHQGVALYALSVFDVLLYDAVAREADEPLYKLLGGHEEAMQAYNSNGLGLAPDGGLAREAKHLIAAGNFSHVKLRLGRESRNDDVAAVRAVKEAIGPDVRLSVDFNQALSPSEALEACRSVDDFGLEWIEEPIVYDDFGACAILARALKTPLQSGENFWGWRAGADALSKQATDYAMPDILRIGGFTGWLKFAGIAARHGVPVSSHLSPEASLHAMAATPNGHWIEYVDWISDFIETPLEPRNGHLRPLDGPGIGIAWNEKAIAPHAID